VDADTAVLVTVCLAACSAPPSDYNHKGWHNSLEKDSSPDTKTQVKYSFVGLCRAVHECARQWDALG
jgi:hypothetical protein